MNDDVGNVDVNDALLAGTDSSHCQQVRQSVSGS